MRLKIIYIVLSCLIPLSSCQDDHVVRTYPQIISSSITSISSEGIVVEATFADLHNNAVQDYGFIWSQNDGDISIDNAIANDVFNKTGVFMVDLGKPVSNSFSANIFYELQAGRTYSVRAYLKTDDLVVYGEPATFTSLGSEGPKITSISPDTVKNGDIITITGRNFGTNRNPVEVLFDFGPRESYLGTKILTVTPTEITVQVDGTIPGKAYLIIFLGSGYATRSSTTITVAGNTVGSGSPTRQSPQPF